MGKEIRTVLGAVMPEALGFASMCDRIFYDGSAECRRIREALPPGRRRRVWLPMDDDAPVSLDNVGILRRNAMLSEDAFRQADEAELAEEVRLYRAAGGAAILDLGTAANPGRAAAVRRISEAAGVPIISTPGYGTADTRPPECLGRDIAGYLEPLLREVRDAPIKPGHLVSSLRTACRDEENALRAVVRAARETGLSMTAYLRGDPEGLAGWVVNILREEGLPPGRAVLSGVPLFTRPSLPAAIRDPAAVSMDTAAAERCLDAGCSLAVCIPNAMGFELAGDYDCGDFLTFAGIYALVEKGYCGQLVLGNDCRGKIMLHGSGGEGYCRLPYYVVPMLRDTAGLSDYAIRQMTAENPARILAA